MLITKLKKFDSKNCHCRKITVIRNYPIKIQQFAFANWITIKNSSKKVSNAIFSPNLINRKEDVLIVSSYVQSYEIVVSIWCSLGFIGLEYDSMLCTKIYPAVRKWTKWHRNIPMETTEIFYLKNQPKNNQILWS